MDEKYVKARQATDDSIIRRMRVACQITKAIDTHSEYVIHVAFPRQQWLRERASIVSYHIISFISVDPYRIRNPYGYGKWSQNHRVYKTIKTIFVSLAPHKLFDILR